MVRARLSSRRRGPRALGATLERSQTDGLQSRRAVNLGDVLGTGSECDGIGNWSKWLNDAVAYEVAESGLGEVLRTKTAR